MQNTLANDLLAATRLTKAGQLTEATAVLQRLLAGRLAPGRASPPHDPPMIDGTVEPAAAAAAKPAPPGRR